MANVTINDGFRMSMNREASKQLAAHIWPHDLRRRHHHRHALHRQLGKVQPWLTVSRKSLEAQMNIEQSDLQSLDEWETTCTPEELPYCVGSYARMETLFWLIPRVKRGKWFQLLGQHWSGCDNVGRYADRLRSLLQFAAPAHL